MIVRNIFGIGKWTCITKTGKVSVKKSIFFIQYADDIMLLAVDSITTRSKDTLQKTVNMVDNLRLDELKRMLREDSFESLQEKQK